MKKFKVYIEHNQFCHANPSAISEKSGNEVKFDIKEISENLKSKIFGKLGILELTREEMQEIYDARVVMAKKIGPKTFNRLFKKV